MVKLGSKDRQKDIWRFPGVPWEIELISLLFVLAAVVLPFYMQMAYSPPEIPITLTIMDRSMAEYEPTAGIENAVGALWSLGIIAVYLIHLTAGGSHLRYNTTPVYYMLAPFAFGAAAYYRLLTQSRDLGMVSPVISGDPVELVLWPFGIFVIVGLVARLRFLRHRTRFKDVNWDIITPTRVDRTFYTVMSQEFIPLIHPARRYHLCPEGIMIEGWLFLVAIPFRSMESVEHVERFSTLTHAQCFATSARNMIQIQLIEQTEPIMISPADHEAVLKYCEEKTDEPIRLVKSKNRDIRSKPRKTG